MYKNLVPVIDLLKKKKLSLSIAESCTGGMLSQAVTSINGASQVFKFGMVVYSNQSKIKYLKVPAKVIQKYGAVSKQCCYAMVCNLSKITKTQLSISVTGIAGPKGGSKLKPIGLVYIGIKKANKIEIHECLFKDKNRESIRKRSVKKSLELIKKLLKKF